MRISDWSSDVCSSDLKFAQRLKRDALEGVRYRDDRLQISPVRTIATPDAEALADRLDAMMPRIRITELLHEVAQETGFLAAFTNMRTGSPCPNELGRASGRDRVWQYVLLREVASTLTKNHTHYTTNQHHSNK